MMMVGAACINPSARESLTAAIKKMNNDSEPLKENDDHLFMVNVAARKWKELQSDGFKMTSIEFSRGNLHGKIDPYGRVSWTTKTDEVSINANNGAAEVTDDLVAKTKCWCTTCRPLTLSDMRFVVCPECGNKRCPKAHNHSKDCTNSNDPGQPGSSWEHVKPGC